MRFLPCCLHQDDTENRNSNGNFNSEAACCPSACSLQGGPELPASHHAVASSGQQGAAAHPCCSEDGKGTIEDLQLDVRSSEEKARGAIEQLSHWRNLINNHPDDPLCFFWKEQVLSLEKQRQRHERCGMKRIHEGQEEGRKHKFAR
uniref:Uncharacterized protein n=1 Tax=Guillardia theta TaxID=55529 RepID=A0A7S4U684_GUITH|mmetsp:Transcript_42544/g.133973  ORF Transcript_42544/g.133973 Transcript_42544/m.133973 type:complete len:147 (+) Transcript_42544:75-515(+)